ncbi:sodium:proton antiporter [Knoellia sinensis KCTC 19936]|uniref:Sodium:proton antiporter n=1 Tax=Knoellia sinensis KCTC 19936 TaxID=1385520 RepID=A0A0A0IZ04_9MICO|nr:Na+/H+ antiporter [Knoellia sinensis]KGN30425.1 sodium:proton antiporter [Knoellia sinensis KCTC 19936]
MDLALTLAGIAVTVIVVARLSVPLGVPSPIALLVVGLIGSLLPFVPQISLDPDVVLLGLLPPLLYAAALNTSLVDIRANRVPILGLSVGLVLFTTLGVALVAWWLLPIPFAVAVAMGAIVAPPDAVAATAVARGIGLPRRITTILEGESLLNDATALVTLRTAIAAAGLATSTHGFASHGPVSVTSVARDFGLAVVGGVGVGWVAFVLIGFVRKRLTEATSDTALSFAAPFLSYLPAEQLGASGVLAVVTTGLLLAHRSIALQSAASRLSERVNWASVTFLLENAVFLLIGLQLSREVADVRASDISLGRAVLVGLAVLAAVLVLRPLWLFPFTWLTRAWGKSDRMPGAAASTAVTSWAGMRGVVTLAAALTLPVATPERPTLVLIALIVTVGTLALQSSTLPWLARTLGVRGPDAREDALQEATILQAATGAGLRSLDDVPGVDPVVTAELHANAELRVNRIWERLGLLGPGESEPPSETRRRLRMVMLDAERRELVRIRDEHEVDHEVLASVMSQLDAEEAALTWSLDRASRMRDSPLLSPDQVARGCEHLSTEPEFAVPADAEGCSDCLREGTTWVHLRMCTHCGNVGCCNSSPGRHASTHHASTGHPVMRSLEPGEAWRWCYVDDVLG